MFIILWIFHLLLSLNLKNENLKKFLKIYAFIILKSRFLENYASQSSEVTLKETEKYKEEIKSRNTHHRKSVKKHRHSLRRAAHKKSLNSRKRTTVEKTDRNQIEDEQVDILKRSGHDDTNVIFRIATDKMKKKSNLSNTFKIKQTVDANQNISSRREMLDMLFEKNEWEEESKYQTPPKSPNESPNLFST